MVSMEDAVIARLDRSGERFEILIDPEAAQKIKDGEKLPIVEYMAIDTIFKDAKKGDRASETGMAKVFKSQDVEDVALAILMDGDIQLTTEQRKKMLELKRKQIVTKIAMNAINPQTKTPHPPNRIEMAMEEAKVHIDPFKPVDLQIQDVLKALMPIIPIRFEKAVFAVKLAGDDYGKCFGDLKQMGRITKQEWTSDGSWIGLIEIPAGMQNDLFDMLNGKTKGRAETKLID